MTSSPLDKVKMGESITPDFDQLWSALNQCGCCATMTPCGVHGGRSWAEMLESRRQVDPVQWGGFDTLVPSHNSIHAYVMWGAR